MSCKVSIFSLAGEELIGGLLQIKFMLHLKARFQAEDYVIYVLWSCSSGNSPVIKTDLRDAIMHIDDINAICPDQWLYCSSYKFVIEFYHEGDILIGFQN